MVRRNYQRSGWLLCLAVTLAAVTAPSCGTTRSGARRYLPPKARPDPTVRVRVLAPATVASFDSAGGLWIATPGRRGWKQRRRRFVSPVTVTRQPGGFSIVSKDGSAVPWAVADLMIVGVSDRSVRVNAAVYPDTVVLHALGDTWPNRFDVVNHVRLETYLPGVLHRELFGSWHPTTFRTQAIAARSYAMYQSRKRKQFRYDLEATTADQAYGGRVANRKAAAAARDSQGLILSHEGALVVAYYSSCCGGTGQDAATSIKDAPDMPPLRGTARGGWCQKSKYFRWGPIQRPARTLARRIAGWGKIHEHEVADLRSIRAIDISQTNAVARPTGFVITDAEGRRFAMEPEYFRFACNFADDALAGPAKDALLRSSHVRVAVQGSAVHFTDGRGFGHGVGLCQWGAQAMAAQGYSEYQILATYYPGAQVTRAY